jgi:hypothetical protein
VSNFHTNSNFIKNNIKARHFERSADSDFVGTKRRENLKSLRPLKVIMNEVNLPGTSSQIIGVNVVRQITAGNAILINGAYFSNRALMVWTANAQEISPDV